MSDYPIIPEMPDPPIRNEAPADFSRKASVFLGFLPTLRTAINDAGAWIQTALGTTLGYKNDAAQSVLDAAHQVSLAEGQAGLALGHANAASGFADDSQGYANSADMYAQVAAATANFKGRWSELSGPLSIPASVYHDGSYWQLLNSLADVSTSEPGVTGDWLGTETEILSWTTITGSATLAPGGHYKVEFPGSPITLTLPAVAPNNTLIRLYRSSGSALGAVIDRNGKTIMGVNENMTLDTDITNLDFISNGTDWRIMQ